MYSWLWRKLPGNRIQKILQAALITVVALVAMYFFVFPWLDVVVFPETNTEIQAHLLFPATMSKVEI